MSKELDAQLAALIERCDGCEAMLDCDECLRADSSQKERKRLDYENAKLRELVRDLWLTGSLCDAIPDMRLQAKGGDWRTMQERVYEALGIEVDA